MNPRAQDFYGELDELELGERVADALFTELAGNIYSGVKDRAWCIVLHCYARCVTSLGAENVPAEWTPVFDEHGMWHMPG